MAAQLKKVRKLFIDGCNAAIINNLLDDLLDKSVLTDSEVEYINECNAITKDRCRRMIDNIKNKGDYSSNILLQCLVENHKTLAKNMGLDVSESAIAPQPILEQNKKTNENTVSEPAIAPQPIQEQNKKTNENTEISSVIHCSDKDFKEIHDTQGDKIYEMRKREGRKRLALIICNEKFETLTERQGAKVDLDGMTKLLNELGYQVLQETNLAKEEMLKVLKEFAAREEHVDSDSTFIVLMSHGDKPGVCGTDSKKIEHEKGQCQVTNLLQTDEIFSIFNNIHCPKLRDKPKVIIIQACRGEERGQKLVCDAVALPPEEQLEDDALHRVQRETDFICFCSSTPDTVSWRHPTMGSLFITGLIKKMNELAHCQPLMDIFLEVQSSFKGQRQMPTQERSTLTKKFYLFPGH
ncbi:hypothetical protein XENTR_v10005242 [Xenopus tropicalis]|uniref:Caspase 1 n=1 Tax=Xenopus tropicalis TaxID=8364 RepID=A0A6I8Q482_XENTR|nr:caspase-1-A isoform X1 [Xenopus tropicalis]KAE8622432.1 hypothetical protein XENTR_v10005242 [Xenopus tropicalis]